MPSFRHCWCMLGSGAVCWVDGKCSRLDTAVKPDKQRTHSYPCTRSWSTGATCRLELVSANLAANAKQLIMACVQLSFMYKEGNWNNRGFLLLSLSTGWFLCINTCLPTHVGDCTRSTWSWSNSLSSSLQTWEWGYSLLPQMHIRLGCVCITCTKSGKSTATSWRL